MCSRRITRKCRLKAGPASTLNQHCCRVFAWLTSPAALKLPTCRPPQYTSLHAIELATTNTNQTLMTFSDVAGGDIILPNCRRQQTFRPPPVLLGTGCSGKYHVSPVSILGHCFDVVSLGKALHLHLTQVSMTT